ncbi:hypothetical protein LZ31DRAFT_419184, partial [Colletotrichum somersetense]
MATKLQAFITHISGGRRRNDELSEMQRVAIASYVLAGRSYREAARTFNCSIGAVQNTINRFSTNHTFKSRPRKGRPEKLSRVEKKAIIRSTRINPPQTYAQLAKEWKHRVCLRTIQKALRQANYRK